MHAALRLVVVLCITSIVAKRVPLHVCAIGALRTDDAMQICGLSASLKLTARTCEGLVEQALRIEKDAFEKIMDTEEALRTASRKVTEVDTKLATLPDALRRLQADVMAAERSVDDAWSRYYALRAGVRALVRRVAAVVPKAASAAGKIDNFIAAFATADSHKNFRCITELGDPSILEFADRRNLNAGRNYPASLLSNLTGCTYENYTLSHPQNTTTTIVDDVVVLGEDGMLCTSYPLTTFENPQNCQICPFLLNDFVRKGGTPMNWGGFWVAEHSNTGTVIRFNREKRHALLGVARELGELEWLLSNGSRRDGRWLRAGRRTTKTIPQLAADVDKSLLIVHQGASSTGGVKDVVDAILKEAEGVQTFANMSEPKNFPFKRPERRRRERKNTSSSVAESKRANTLAYFPLLLMFFFPTIV
ncbi:hypothetical protein ERJ75_000454800 [Trypanosoma vivax]|nr:hypothetical protein ERJ75_000454800 [Trypanosoma vivax]